ncbi:NUDIX domain-containing protein [Candidatus Woesearchaeota archaeon]|nr:NUDIX domain-containing protein [Candidatus Woesearchaeota archaeon]
MQNKSAMNEDNPEIIDIVNEQDKIIGRDTRFNIHKKHLIHRGVHIFIINSKNQVLIQKRSFNKDFYPGYYDASVGAHVDSGESYKDAAVREIKEEVGIIPKKLTGIGSYKSYSERQKENRKLFVCKSDGPFKINKDELDKIEFKSIDEIQKMIEKGIPFTEGFKKSLELLIKWKQKQE